MSSAIRFFLRALPFALGVTFTAANARAEIAFSPDGAHLAMSAPADQGLMVFDINSGVLSTLTNTPSSGYAFAWSPNGTMLGFKVLHAAGDGYLQEPVVYDATNGSLRSLAAPSPLAGVPSFSARGDVAFTIGHNAIVVDANGGASRYDLGQYVNLVALSPDGKTLAYNDADDSIWVLELSTGNRRLVVSDPSYAPAWSPNGKRLLLRGINGTVACADLERGGVVPLGRGMSPAWLPDGEHVMFTAMEVPRGDGRTPPVTVEKVHFDGTGRQVLSGTTGYDARVSPDGQSLVYRSELDAAPIVAHAQTRARSAAVGTPLMDMVRSRRALNLPPTREETPSRGWRIAPVKIPDVPYLHQVYDTPNHFNGHSACNATSAVMTLAYYGVIDNWDTTVDVPSPHVSHFGNYVSEKYTINGHTLDVGSADPNGAIAYGGYGYIVQGDWEETRGHMAEYIEFHGPSSAVDWSPSWDKVISEIDAKHPFVVLTSITSAGHYIVDIGYHSDQHTAIFNDPYGNKNEGYMNYNGAGVNYDWPGYNNGFSNLSTVHCFIWSRSTVQPEQDAGPPPDAAAPEDASTQLDATQDDASTAADAAAPEAATQEDASTTPDAANRIDAAPSSEAGTAPDNYTYGADEPDGCACTAAGGSTGSDATPWGVLMLLVACALRRRGGTESRTC